MVKPVKQSLGFLKTTALGGVIFLLPLIVIGTLLGQVVQVVLGVANALSKTLPIDSPGAWTLLVLLAIALVLAACFVAGLVARWTLGQRLTAWLEKNLTLFFPRYVIVKARMAGSIGGNQAKSELKPVLVRFNEMTRMAFEVERAQTGLVTIYLPGARSLGGHRGLRRRRPRAAVANRVFRGPCIVRTAWVRIGQSHRAGCGSGKVS